MLNHPTGAPYVIAEGAPPGLEVALTDRAGWAVCLVGTAMGRLGCDLELVEPRSAGFVADFLTAFERDWVQALPATDRDAAANLIWSAKESALKVLQIGLRRDTRSVEVAIGDAGAVSTDEDGTGQDGWSPLEVRPAEGGVLPGWWRRGGRFLLTVVTESPLPPPDRAGRVAGAGARGADARLGGPTRRRVNRAALGGSAALGEGSCHPSLEGVHDIGTQLRRRR